MDHASKKTIMNRVLEKAKAFPKTSLTLLSLSSLLIGFVGGISTSDSHRNIAQDVSLENKSRSDSKNRTINGRKFPSNNRQSDSNDQTEKDKPDAVSGASMKDDLQTYSN